MATELQSKKKHTVSKKELAFILFGIMRDAVSSGLTENDIIDMVHDGWKFLTETVIDVDPVKLVASDNRDLSEAETLHQEAAKIFEANGLKRHANEEWMKLSILKFFKMHGS